MMKYIDGLESFLQDLEEFIDSKYLPAEWFKTPDHVAVKCANTDDYQTAVASYEPVAEQMSVIELDGRRLATARLASSLLVASFGSVSWVEIMEPRPEKVGSDVVGFEHMEFVFPDFEVVKDVLSERNIAFEQQSNPNHAWINIVINTEGQELKLNDRGLAAIVEDELESGQATLL